MLSLMSECALLGFYNNKKSCIFREFFLFILISALNDTFLSEDPTYLDT